MGERLTTAEVNGLRGRRWTAADARLVLKTWRASGLSMAAFGARHGLAAERLGWWKKRLDDWREVEAGARVSPLVPAIVRVRGAEAAVAIRLPAGVVLKVMDAAAVEPSWLAAVVSALSRSA